LLYEKGLIAHECSDEAINQTRERLKYADTQIHNGTAKLRIPWRDRGDQRPRVLGLLYWGTRPVAKFQLVKGAWKMNANWQIGFQRPADFFDPASWFYFYPGRVALDAQITADINRGKLRTAEETAEAYETRWKAFIDKVEAERKKRQLNPVEARFFAAWRIFERYKGEYYAGRGSLGGICAWSQRLMEAEIARSTQQSERIAAAVAHLDRMADVRHEVRKQAALGAVPYEAYTGMDADFADARILAAAVNGGANQIPSLALGTARVAATKLTYGAYWDGVEREHKTEPEENRIRHLPFQSAWYWSRRWLLAELGIAHEQEDRLAAAEAYLDRTRQLDEIVQKELKSEQVGKQEVAEDAFYRADAEARVAELRDTGKDKKTYLQAARRKGEAAKGAYQGAWDVFQAGRQSPLAVLAWSIDWRDAALEAATTSAERLSAATSHLERMKSLRKITKELVDAGRIPTFEFWAAEYYVADAEIQLSEMKQK
jgi:hypothetical protein